MVASPKAAVRNGHLFADHSAGSSTRRRSNSVPRSERSSQSRVTLVEEDREVTEYQEPTIHDSYKIVHHEIPKFTRWDHFLGIIGIDVSKRKKPVMRVEIVQPSAPSTPPDTPDSYSPWVLPVYVLSPRTDSTGHQIKKVAKCTLDTGNWQGNIVSREFILNVLMYSDSDISSLKEDEKEGGVGITGDTFVPQGAIHLTWYNKKSCRVFRNMRFLVSPNMHFDLIIGARSIQKDGLLDVPNFMAEKGGRTVVPVLDVDPEWDRLRNVVKDLAEKVGTKKTEKLRLRRNLKDRARLEEEIATLEAEKQTAEEKFQLCHLKIKEKSGEIKDLDKSILKELREKYEPEALQMGKAATVAVSGNDVRGGHAQLRGHGPIRPNTFNG